MSSPQASIEQLLHKKELRITPARLALLQILRTTSEPLGAPRILAQLHTHGQPVNKTTVYRELTTLTQKGIVQELDFGEGKKRYEFVQTPHHHAICTKCQRVEHVQLPSHLETEEALLKASSGFTVQSHTLEFFGTCRSCSA